MAKPPPGTTADQQAAAYGIANLRRHILLCAGPDCVDAPTGDTAWTYLKKRIAELNLSADPFNVYRTKCHCLRICTQGPILVIQPDNVWYRHATPPIIERILQEHILLGHPVAEYLVKG